MPEYVSNSNTASASDEPLPDKPCGLVGDIARLVSRVLSLGAIALLGYAIVCLILAWVLAIYDGTAPNIFTYEQVGSGSPWDRGIRSGTLLEQAMFLAPMSAIPLSALAWVIRPNTRAGIVFIASLAWMLIVAATHGWLIM